MVENEIDEVIHSLVHRLNMQGFDLNTYLKTRDIDLKALREEARPVAEMRIRRSLVLFKIAEQENIQVESSELQTETERTIGVIGRFASDAERKKIYSQNFIRSTAANLYTEMRIGKTLERIRNIARGMIDDGFGGDHQTQVSLAGANQESQELSTVSDPVASDQSPQGLANDQAGEATFNNSDIEN